jgi:AIPR protein
MLVLPQEAPVSQIDLEALTTHFTNWKLERLPTTPVDKAFERYCAEQILKDYELSDEEITSGACGGSDDGGVDGLFFFAGRRLMRPQVDVPDEASSATLLIIQATVSSGGFSETRIERFEAFARDLLDYHTPPDKIMHIDMDTRRLISTFRTAYGAMAGRKHSLDVVFYYAAKTSVTRDRNSKVHSRYKRLERYVKSQLTNATVKLALWNCSDLIKRVREQPEKTLALQIDQHFSTPNGDVVCLSNLKHFFAFLRRKDGQLHTGILEPNVRDYQGKRNPVNKDIRATLESSPVKEFWWLNNGITILAESCSVTGDRLTITNPEIVNGLQTSHEVFSFYTDAPPAIKENRSILLRIIIPPDEKSGSLITKATNFQTEVRGISLHATEEIHFNIEDKLLQKGLFYDRKKGKYKRLKRPVSQIVSVVELARSVIAIVLRRPDDARARPQSLLGKDDTYLEIFDKKHGSDMYLAVVSLDRKVAAFLNGYSKATPEETRDIRFYLDMWLACEVINSPRPTPTEIGSHVEGFCNVDDALLEDACKRVLKKYRRLGGTEQIAKGSVLAPVLQRALNRALPRKK